MLRASAGQNIITGCGAGGLIRITPRTTYTVNPQASQTQDTVLVKYVETTLWVSGRLVVRVHARTLAAGQSFDVTVQNVSYAEEEPQTDFIESGAGIGTATINTSGTVPGALGVALTGFAAMVRVIITARQAGTPSSFSCTIGVDLIGRPA